MNKKIQAVYEDGVFKPSEPMDLPDHAHVEFEITLVDDSAKPSLEDVYAILGNRFDSGQDDVAERYDEHQS
jgi:predicted DNA-binding antitoxin AbrB/MazE fold protein